MKASKLLATSLMAMIIAALLIFAGCKKDDSNSGGKTHLQVRMVDAPSPYAFQEINIDVVGVEANINGQWYPLNYNPGVYNILTLVNGTDVLIADDNIPAGFMSQMRLILGHNNSIRVDGVLHQLTIPSGSESGLKLNVHQDLPFGDFTFMIDFDAAHSIVVQGNGEYKLKPVLHGFTVETSGKIAGTILPAGIGIAIIAQNTANADLVYTAYADVVSGQFLLQGMVAGTYTVQIYPAGTNIPITVPNVVVSNNTTTSIGLITAP